MGEERAFKKFTPYRGGATKRTLGERNEELVERERWANYLFDFFQQAVASIFGYDLDRSLPDVQAYLKGVEAEIQALLTDHKPAYRSLAHVYHALALVEWHVLQLSDMTRENLEVLAESLEARVLDRQTDGRIKILGRSYELHGRLAEVDGASKLVEYLGQLDGMVRHHEHEREAREIHKLRTSPVDASGRLIYPLLSLQEFLTTEQTTEARCEIQLARETPKKGPVRQSGTIFLRSDVYGNVYIDHAFHGVARYVRRKKLLGVPVPRAVLASRTGFSVSGKVHPRRRETWKLVYELVERGFRTAERDKAHDVDRSRRPRRPVRRQRPRATSA